MEEAGVTEEAAPLDVEGMIAVVTLNVSRLTQLNAISHIERAR